MKRLTRVAVVSSVLLLALVSLGYSGTAVPKNTGFSLSQYLATLVGLGEFNVKNYGALCNGTHDDTSAINTAAAAAAAAHGTLSFPGGSCVVTSSVVVSNSYGLVMRGNSADLSGTANKGTTILWHGTTEAAFNIASPSPVLWIKNCHSCLFENFSIGADTGYRAAESIRITTQSSNGPVSTRNVFRHLVVGGNSEIGVRVGGTFGTNTSGGTGVVTGAIDSNNDFHSFEDVTFTGYGNKGLYLEDTQVYRVNLVNVLFQVSIATSSSGAMTSGLPTLTVASGLFTTKDVQKVVEVANAGSGGLALRARILSITNATHVVLDTNASNTTGAGATISYGAQAGIYSRYCSFSTRGGGAGAHMSADYFVGGGQPAPILIEGAVNEGSRRLLATDGPSGGTWKQTTLRNVRFAGNAVVNTTNNGNNGSLGNDSYAISYIVGGGLLIEHSTIGDPDTSSPIKILFGAGQDVPPWNQHSQFTVSDSVISSSYAAGSIFVQATPRFLGSNRLSGTGAASSDGVDVLGEVPRSFPVNPADGGLTVSFGQANSMSLVLNGNATLTLRDLPIGTGSSRDLWIQHSAGPWAVTWPVGTYFSSAAGASDAGLWDRNTIRFDGTNYYVDQRLGYGQSFTDSQDVTLGAFGNSPNANGASLSGQQLTLQPADATHPGGVQTGGVRQEFALNPLIVDGGIYTTGNLGVDGGIIARGAIQAAGGLTLGNTASGCGAGNSSCDWYSQGGKMIQGANATAHRFLAGTNAYELAYWATASDVQKAWVNNDGGYEDFTGRIAIKGQNPADPTCEYGQDAGATGAMTYDFLKAFASRPVCTCADNGVAPVACGITAASTARVSALATGAGSDVVGVICCGPRGP